MPLNLFCRHTISRKLDKVEGRQHCAGMKTPYFSTFLTLADANCTILMCVIIVAVFPSWKWEQSPSVATTHDSASWDFIVMMMMMIMMVMLSELDWA